MFSRDITLNTVKITDLRPTQISVGLHEVQAKRHHWKAVRENENKATDFIQTHMIPVVLGPKSNHYIIDHHHLARALLEEGVDGVLVTVVADLSALSKSSFWVYMDNRGWCHPYDNEGVRRDFNDIPKAIANLSDDPYRSLAGALRLSGGFAKDTTPFSEFIWADFLRSRINQKKIAKDFESALNQALNLAKSKAAGYLPGWCGPT